MKLRPHLVLLYLLVGCLVSCTLTKRAGVPIVVGTAVGVLAGGGIPLVIGIVAAAGTWTAGVIVEKVTAPDYPAGGPAYFPPEVPWYDPWNVLRLAFGWAVIALLLWLLAKRWSVFGTLFTGFTLGFNKLIDKLLGRRRKLKDFAP